MFQTVQETTNAIATLMAWLENQPDGSTISWMECEKATSVTMAIGGPGRGWVRRALQKLKRPYEAIRGNGIRLSSPSTAINIADHRIVRIDGMIKVGARVNKQLTSRHLDEMTPDEQRGLIARGALYGAFRAVASQNKVMLKKGPAGPPVIEKKP